MVKITMVAGDPKEREAIPITRKTFLGGLTTISRRTSKLNKLLVGNKLVTLSERVIATHCDHSAYGTSKQWRPGLRTSSLVSRGVVGGASPGRP